MFTIWFTVLGLGETLCVNVDDITKARRVWDVFAASDNIVPVSERP